MIFSRQLILAAAVAALVSGAALAAAEDGESKTLINNSYQQTGEVSCEITQNFCVVLFPPMTDAKTVITGVTCSVYVTPGSFVGFSLSHYGTGVTVFLPAFVYGQNTALQVATNATTHVFYNSGDQAAVYAEVSNGGQFVAINSLDCTISGYHS